MNIAVKCPSCSYKGQVPDKFQGKAVKCPGCGKQFTVSGKAPATVSATAAPTAKKAAETGEMSAASAPAGQAGKKAAAKPEAATKPEAGAKPEAAAKVKPKEGLGTLDFDSSAPARPTSYRRKQKSSPYPKIMGLLAILAALVGGGVIWVPGLVIAGLALGGAGVLLGVVGVFWDMLQQRFGLTLSTMGFLLSGVALGLACCVQFGVIPVAKPTDDQLAKGPEATGPEATPSTQPEKPPVKPLPSKNFAVVGQAVRTGNVRMQLIQATIVPVAGKDLPDTARQPHLLLQFDIENTSSKPLDMLGGGAEELSQEENAPKLTTSQGRTLERVNFGPKAQVEGQLGKHQVPGDQRVRDMLIFQLPGEKVDYLWLELPGSNFGGSVTLHFKIDGDKIEDKSAATPPDGGTKPPPPPPPPPPQVLDAAMLKKLRAGVKSPNAKVREDTANTIGELGAPGAALTTELTGLLSDKADNVRVAAAAALGKIGRPAMKAIPALTKALEDEFWRVHVEAAKALGEMGPAAKGALPLLNKLLKSKDKEVPPAAKAAINKIKGGK